jgi:hypothetical protein
VEITTGTVPRDAGAATQVTRDLKEMVKTKNQITRRRLQVEKDPNLHPEQGRRIAVATSL